jgi:hypothetical protein
VLVVVAGVHHYDYHVLDRDRFVIDQKEDHLASTRSAGLT